jgi:hypothetical protein
MTHRPRRLALSRQRRGHLGRTAAVGETNSSWFDKYTVVHFGSGVAVEALSKGRVGPWATLAICVAWEVGEYAAKHWFPTVFEPYDAQDTWKNMVSDTAAMMLGWWVSHSLPDRAWL